MRIWQLPEKTNPTDGDMLALDDGIYVQKVSVATLGKRITESSTPEFTSSDTTDADASAWTSVSKLTSGTVLSGFFASVSQMFKNIRYLYKMFSTVSLSALANGTLLTSGTDLNSLTTIGNYYTNMGSLTNSLVNKPSALSGIAIRLFVMDVGYKSGYCAVQVIFTNTSIYLRGRNNDTSTWYSWREVSLTTVS